MQAQIPFYLAYLAIALCWVPRSWWPSWAIFLAAVLLALRSHLTPTGISLIGLAGLAVYAAAKSKAKTDRFPERKLLLFMFTLPLFLFQYIDIPGFSLLPVVSNAVISEGAEPYSLELHFGPLAFGFLYYRLLISRPSSEAWKKTIEWTAILTFVLCTLLLGTALVLHYVRWDPKLPSFFWIWTLSNLFFVAVPEESLFRGALQDGLSRLGKTGALISASLLFGMFHAKWGLPNVALAAVAGVVFGYGYQKTARLECAILLHFFVNVIHFYFFTYPRLG